MTQLSPHFSLAEFTHSETADEHGIPNTPTPEHLAHLEITAAGMEAVRALFGVPITVTDAYRNPQVNHLVGGVPTSAHCLGWAVDFHVQGLSDNQAAKRIAASGIKFDQLIYEGTAARPRCVHISFDPRHRQQILSQPGRPGTSFLPGIKP